MTPQSPTKAVVFDFGGVLITPITNLLDEVAEWHSLPMVDMLNVLLGPREYSTPDHPWHRAERGELATDAMQEAAVPFARAAGITLRGDEYDKLLCGVFDLHHEVIERISTLREEGYITGLLTNSFIEFRDVIEGKVDFALFDVVIDSSEVGLRKPEPAIYELTTERLGVRPGEVLYLDDFEGNVVGARAHGWRVIHVTDRESILPQLAAALASG